MDYVYFLRACLEQELHDRHQKKQRALLRQAKFPSPKTLADFDFTKVPQLPKMKMLKLAEGAFINRHENVFCIGKESYRFRERLTHLEHDREVENSTP